MSKYYVHNLETDKVNVFTGGKSEWLALPDKQREDIKRACLWSRTQECWVSRAKGGSYWLLKTLKEAGFEDQGKTGERLSFAEQVEQKQERAEARAERFEDRAENAAEKSNALYKHAHAMEDCIPMGQPILVGHYSEGRDRRFRERIHKTFGRAFEEGDKAKYYERRAAVSRASASGEQYSDPRYLGNRIKEVKAEIAVLENRLQGKYYSYSEPRPISEADRERWEPMLDEQHEKLGFLQHCLDTCGVTVYSKETLKDKTAVKIRGRWEPIVRLNPTTVAVPNICFPLEADQRKYALKYAYTAVQEAR